MTIETRINIKKGQFQFFVDTQFPSQGVTALFGPSGCGKTSFLRAIAGLDYHENSFVKIGDSIWQDDKQFVPAYRRAIGYVFQHFHLFPHLDVQGNINFGVKRIPPDERKIDLQIIIELMGLKKLMNRQINQLSGGEQQRVAIARALAVSPKILLMDEPLASLDSSHKQDILPYLSTLHNELEIPIIYVSHSIDEITRLADYLLILDSQKILAAGPISDILTRLDLPLARNKNSEVIIEARVHNCDNKYNITYCEFSGGKIVLAKKGLNIGQTVRLRIAARDVSLTLHPQKDTTILNILPAIVDDLIKESESLVVVRLLIKDTLILSRITYKSAHELGLQRGTPVYVQIKSVALLG